MPALPEKGDPVTVARGLKPGALLGSPCRLRKLALLLGWVFISLFGAGVLTNFLVDIIIDQTNISITPAGVRLLSLGFLGPLTSEPSPSFGHWRRGGLCLWLRAWGGFSSLKWGRYQNRACPRSSWGTPLVGPWLERPG